MANQKNRSTRPIRYVEPPELGVCYFVAPRNPPGTEEIRFTGLQTEVRNSQQQRLSPSSEQRQHPVRSTNQRKPPFGWVAPVLWFLIMVVIPVGCVYGVLKAAATIQPPREIVPADKPYFMETIYAPDHKHFWFWVPTIGWVDP
jgi:hypothetical protein